MAAEEPSLRLTAGATVRGAICSFFLASEACFNLCFQAQCLFMRTCSRSLLIRLSHTAEACQPWLDPVPLTCPIRFRATE